MKKSISFASSYLVVGAALLSAASEAWAVTTVYTNRAAFNAAASGPLTLESFEDEVVSAKTSPTTLNGSNLVVSLVSNTPDIQVRNTDPNGYSTVNTTSGGSQFLSIGYNNTATGAYTAQFARSSFMNAFGFDLSGYQGNSNFPPGSFGVTLLNGATVVDSFSVTDTTTGAAHFNGLVSTTPFNAIRFTFSPLGSATGSADILAFDEVAFNVVPEPSSLALIGLTGAMLLRRRQHSAS